jgi:cysteine synthase A
MPGMYTTAPRRNSELLAILCTGTAVVVMAAVLTWIHSNNKRASSHNNKSRTTTAHEQLIINGTPIVKLEIVSQMLRRNIYVKMESLNPGGTGKDRAALSMIRRAEEEGLLPRPIVLKDGMNENDLLLRPSIESSKDDVVSSQSSAVSSDIGVESKNDKGGAKAMEEMIVEAMKRSRTGGLVVEGTSGSTGIALATLCAARGHACLVVLPDDQAKEKQTILRSLGAVVYEVPTAAISNPNHYVNLARKAAILARETLQIDAVFTDQFENDANYDIHYRQTGPEIWKQRRGRVDAFVMSSGTGGTIAGVGTYLKERNSSVQIVLVDPPGSALYHKIEHGVAYALEQRERTLRKHRYDTLAEGIGLDRVTHNFSLGLDSVDRAIRVTDQEAVDMAHWMLRMEGLWMGSSSSMNLVGAVRVALDMPPGSNVVTMICDAGQRHATRFWNPSFIQEWGLKWPDSATIPECLRPVEEAP